MQSWLNRESIIKDEKMRNSKKRLKEIIQVLKDEIMSKNGIIDALKEAMDYLQKELEKEKKKK